MKDRAAFVMPVKLRGEEVELRLFREAVDSIKNQTDKNWILIMVDDFSDDENVSRALDGIKNELGERAHLIRLAENVGAGQARNVGIRYAEEIGAPFIVFNDSDDVSHPRRLELVRKTFAEDAAANVIYMSFDVIDEHNRPTPMEEICPSVREIILGHRKDVVEGENAWAQIAAKKGYTNLTSCTAVRTRLAVAEPFPKRSVSEDSHTWFRYGAHPGKFVFLREIKNHYRIRSGTQSRSRSNNDDFYEQKSAVDRAGFEAAAAIARGLGRITAEEETEIRARFYVRLALSMLYGDGDACAEKLMRSAAESLPEITREAVEALDCDEAYREKLRNMIA